MLRKNPNAVQYLPTPQHPLTPPIRSYTGEMVSAAAIGGGIGAVAGGIKGGLLAVVGGGLAGIGLAALGTAAYIGAELLFGDNEQQDIRRGMRDVLNKAYIKSGQYLQAPIGPRSQLAGSMRQQMMMAIHNSAYTMRGAIGREAQILHR